MTNIITDDSGWASLELATEKGENSLREALTDTLLAQTLRDSATAPAFMEWRESMGNVAPNCAASLLNDLPVQTRDDLHRRLDQYQLPRFGPLKQVRTSGSTGRSLQFNRSQVETRIEHSFVASVWRRLDVSQGATGAVLVGRTFPDSDHKVDARGVLWISCVRAEEQVWQRVTELLGIHRPEYLRGYGSIVGEYFAFLANAGIRPPGVSAVAYSSDYMSPAHKDAIHVVIGRAPIGLYGQAERAIMAATCEYSGQYHVLGTYGRMELLDRDGKLIGEPGIPGDIVGTSLWPRSTAIVRYRTGDRGAWVDGPCECGRTQARFQLLAGRERDILIDNKGERWIFGPALYEPVAQILDSSTAIQFAHPEPGVLVVRLSRTHSQKAREIKHLLDRALGTAFEVAIVNEEPVRTKAGKRLLLDLT